MGNCSLCKIFANKGKSVRGFMENNNKFVLPTKLNSLYMGFIGIGIVSLIVGFYVNSHRAWGGFLVLIFFLLSLGLSGGFFASVQYISGATWSLVIRRISEVMFSILPYVGGLVVLLFFGIHELYEWSHADVVAKDHILQQKKAYLNTPFFIARIVFYFIVWYGLGRYLYKTSILQDKTKDAKLKPKLTAISAGYLLAFAYFFALASIDLVMSLEPHWYSTMFPVYTFASMAYLGVAMHIIILKTIQNNGGLKDVSKEHYHDLGKFLLMFTIFWAYIAFCQFMLMWYANLPEETIYLEKRFGNSTWKVFTVLFWIGHFVIPFFILLSREIKRDANKLVKVAWFCLFMGFVDMIWMIYGGIYQHNHIDNFPIGWMEIGLFLGAIGLFHYVVLNLFQKKEEMPIGHPEIKESISFHQSH